MEGRKKGGRLKRGRDRGHNPALPKNNMRATKIKPGRKGLNQNNRREHLPVDRRRQQKAEIKRVKI